jgi:hypothetical protein
MQQSPFKICETLADFDPVTWGAALPSSRTFGLTMKYRRFFIDWCRDLHNNRFAREDHPIIAQHLTKYEKLICALALIFRFLSCAAIEACGQIDCQAALRVTAWCAYLKAHARRCYGLFMDDGLRAVQALAAKINQGELPDKFTARDVRCCRWRYLTTDGVVQAALDCLEDEGWLRGSRDGYGQGAGKSPWRYSIKPIKVLTMLSLVSRRSLMAAMPARHLHVCGIF